MEKVTTPIVGAAYAEEKIIIAAMSAEKIFKTNFFFMSKLLFFGNFFLLFVNNGNKAQKAFLAFGCALINAGVFKHL